MSRSIAVVLLLGASLFSLLAYEAVASDAPPSAVASGRLRKPGVPARVLTPAPAAVLPFPLLRGNAPLLRAAAGDHSRIDAKSQAIADTQPATADLSLQASEPITVVPGATTAYTFTIRNQGPAPATGIVLTHTLATGLTPVSTRPAQPWCDRQDRSVSCSIGDVHPSDATTITLDLSIGGNQTHQTETQMAGVTLDLSTPNCTINASQSSITCRMTRLAAGAETQIRIGVRADAQTTGTLVSRARVTAEEADPDPSNNQAVLTMTVVTAAPATVTPASATDLVMQADGPSSVIAGQPFTYTYSITNRGELDATGVHFEDALPPTANLYGYSPGLPACEPRGDFFTCSLSDPDTGETITFNLAITGTAGQPLSVSPDPLMPGWPMCTVLKERTWLHILNCELGTLKRGQTTHIQLGLVAIGVQERTMDNGASVSAHETDLNPSNNTITATMTVSVRADLSLRSAVSGPAVAGQPLSYTLTVANRGPSDADGVVLTDTLPAGTRFVSVSARQGDDCRLEQKEGAAGTVVCRLSLLSGGATGAVTIVLKVDPAVATPASAAALVHSAKVTSEQPDPDLSNNVLSESIPVGGGG